jgi:hypothetical protein
MNRNGDLIRVAERSRAALECGIVEIPLRRRELPDQLGKIAGIFVVAGPAAFRGEIVLVPPRKLGLRRQWRAVRCLTADQIAAHRDQRGAALRPNGRDDAGCPGAPIEPGDNRLLDLEGIHQIDQVDRERALLAIPQRVAGKKSRGAIAAQMRHDHPESGRHQDRGNVDEGVNVVGPTV